MERSFKTEVGKGILAVTKADRQSGVSYVGGYQSVPVSHLMDVHADAHDVLEELGKLEYADLMMGATDRSRT